MANTSVTYRYQFGAALDEAGFNLVSASLWSSHPGMFTYTTEIVVKPADPAPPASPAHKLTVYAVADKPFSISLYPVALLPQLPPDSFLLEGNVSFSLTDSVLGTITLIGVTFQSQAKIGFASGNAFVSVLSFTLTDIRGEQPPLAAVVASAGKELLMVTDDGALGRTFVAIVQYLAQLYLNAALEKAVVQFPIPRIDQLAGFGTLGQLPVDGMFIRNKAFYVQVGDDLGSPAAFPGSQANPADLRLGISTSGITRVIGAFLPMPVNLELGNSGTTLHLTSNLVIPEIDFRLIPGAAKIPVAVHLSGIMNLHVQMPIPILGGTFSFDVPLPIDPLTQYAGSVVASLQIGDFNADPNAEVSVELAPDVSFLGAWVALIVTNYRDYLSNAFQNAAQNAVDQLIGKSFCQIPILGWIVCGTINVISRVAGYLVGAVLDFFVSTFLTGIVDTLGRIVLAILKAPNFKVLHFNQSNIQKLLGTTILDGRLEIVDNGRDADLQADLYFESQGLPVPMPPQPVQPLPPPQPEPVPPFPSAPVLPVYSASDFNPNLALPVPAWTDGQTQRFSVDVQSSQQNVIGTGSVTFLHSGNRWQLHHVVVDKTGVKLTDAWAYYDDASFNPLSSNYASPAGTTTFRQLVDLSVTPGSAIVSLGADGQTSAQSTVGLLPGVPEDFDEFWIYRFAHGPVSASLAGKFGRIGVVLPSAARNWAREIPVSVSIAAGTLNWGSAGGAPSSVPVWIVTGTDEQNQLVAYVAKDGSGLLKMTITSGATISTTIRQ